MSLVNVMIVGNVVRQPELLEFQNGKQKTTITVAIKAPAQVKTNEDRWETEFYRVETWGKLAEIAAKYLSKGSHFGASGRLVLDKWQDKNGRERVTPVVKADQISLPPRLQAVQAQEAITDGPPPAKELNLAAEECSENEYDEAKAQSASGISRQQSEQLARAEAARIARTLENDSDHSRAGFPVDSGTDASPEGHIALPADAEIAQAEFGGMLVSETVSNAVGLAASQ